MINLLPSAGLIAAAIVFHALARGRNQDMPNAALQASVDALLTEVTENTSKLASIQAFIEGTPEMVAEAVRQALEEVDAEADAIAELVDEARQTMSDNVDSALAAINANTPPEELPAEEPPAEPVE